MYIVSIAKSQLVQLADILCMFVQYILTVARSRLELLVDMHYILDMMIICFLAGSDELCFKAPCCLDLVSVDGV